MMLMFGVASGDKGDVLREKELVKKMYREDCNKKS